MGQILLGALAAGLDSQARADRSDPGCPLAPATLEAMRAHIERHLASPQLTPEQICRTFHCSRSYLYRLFESGGGVAHYIRERRLARCYRELTGTGGASQGIGELAGRFGFVSQSHFTRLFRKAFGLSPTMALHQARLPHPDPGVPSGPECPPIPAYRHWLLKL